MIYLFLGHIVLADSVLAASALADAVLPDSTCYGIAAEGYTSRNAGQAAELSGRMFTAPMAEALCKNANRSMKLASNHVVRIPVGELYSLKSLKIDAWDQQGGFLKRVPVSIGVPDIDGTLLDYRHHDLTLQAQDETSVKVEVMSYCVPSIRHYITLSFYQNSFETLSSLSPAM